MNSNAKRPTGTTDIWAALMYFTTLLIFALGFLAGMAMTAHADVLCRPKNGAAVRVRAACKTQEVQLDPITLGLQGPAGPTGPQGAQGIAGPTGPAGMDGLNAEVLHLYDGNGQNLGIALDAIGDQRTTYIPELDAILRLAGSGATVGERQIVYFLAQNCAGTPYTAGFLSPQVVVASFTRFFRRTGITLPQPQWPLSKLGPNDVCENQLEGAGDLGELQEVTLPFSLPLTPPITVGLAP